MTRGLIRVEKLRYMHRNPVVRGLVAKPEDWRWSSFRHYANGRVARIILPMFSPDLRAPGLDFETWEGSILLRVMRGRVAQV